MVWVTRDAAGKIVTWGANKRNGAVFLADDSPEFQAILNPPVEQTTLVASILDVLTDAESRTMLTGKPRDLFRLLARNGDEIPISNVKLARLAAAIGTTPAALFARLAPAEPAQAKP